MRSAHISVVAEYLVKYPAEYNTYDKDYFEEYILIITDGFKIYRKMLGKMASKMTR